MVLTTKTVYKAFFTARINPSAAIRIKYRLAGLFRGENYTKSFSRTLIPEAFRPIKETIYQHCKNDFFYQQC